MRTLTIAALATVVLAVPALAGNITIKGSDTMVRLGQRLAEEYMKKFPKSVIQVSGGGSGTGIAALLNNSTDICMASRDMKPAEYKLAQGKGIDVKRYSICLDGIAIFLHNSNPVDDLTLDQLKAIYTGEITNWRDLGGKNAPIVLYGRENNSGTYVYFREHVLKDEDYSERCQTLPGTASVVNAITKDPNGIGYGGIAWATTVKHAGVKVNDTTTAMHPKNEAVADGSYPISRELYFFTRGVPAGEMKNFINWALSPEGREVVELVDYIPLQAEAATANMIK